LFLAMKPFGRWLVDWSHGYRWRGRDEARWITGNENHRGHFTERRRGVEFGAELDHPSGQELAPLPRSASGTDSVASSGVARMFRRPGKRAIATSMAASHSRREKAQTSSAPSPCAKSPS
jgi:hypothetical protein